MKKLNIKIMTKQVADTLAKEIAVRGKKVDRGIAVKRIRPTKTPCVGW